MKLLNSSAAAAACSSSRERSIDRDRAGRANIKKKVFLGKFSIIIKILPLIFKFYHCL
jgi:hypothetical protein